MNFLNLRYFTVTAEEKSFTDAAKKLCITQQSLSSHISRLEEEFGVSLFKRTQPLTLTKAGERFLELARGMLLDEQETVRIMQDYKDERSSSLTVGVSTSRGSSLLASVLPAYHSMLPEVKLRLVEGTTKQINEALYAGKTDINIGFEITDDPNVENIFLHTDRIACVVPKPFLEQYPALKSLSLDADTLQPFDAFEACPFIAMNEDTSLGQTFLECCRQYGVSPEVVLKTSSMSTLVSLCSAGLGAILLPEFYLHYRVPLWEHTDWRNSIVTFPLDYEQGIKNITVSHLRSRYVSFAGQKFIKLCLEKLK